MSVQKPNYVPEDPNGHPYALGDPEVHGWYLCSNGSRVHFVNGKISRDDGPAWIYPNGSEGWYKNDFLHRDDDLPAVTMLDSEGRMLRQGWYRNGMRHRDNDKPAGLEYEYEGKEITPAVTKKLYYLNDEMTRSGGPAYEVFHLQSRIFMKYVDVKFGGLHRVNGPAIYGQGHEEYWYCNRRHRENGPAIAIGSYEAYFLDGKEVSRREVTELYASANSMMPQIAKEVRQEVVEQRGEPEPVEMKSEMERRERAAKEVSAWKSKRRKM